MFHPFIDKSAKDVELPKLFTNPFDYEPHPLVEMAHRELCDYIEGRSEWHEEIERGKMFGVLVVSSESGELGFLAAFSGYLDKRSQHSYFVPPACDLLDPNGFFIPEETNISLINRAIASLEASQELASDRVRLSEITEQESATIGALKEEYRRCRAERQVMRSSSSAEELRELASQSQRQKGHIKREELRYRTLREPLEERIKSTESQIARLKAERQERSAALQELTFDRFMLLNGEGDPRSVTSIFKEYNHTTPPAGSGECAAPKLLHYAFSNSLTPIAMGEFWWGESPRGEVRRHMHYYPACRGKCHPILSYMLRGLEVEPLRETPQESSLEDRLKIIYEDDYIIAYNKPSGLLSVRGLNHTLSVQSIAEERYPQLLNNMIVHRLDMDTSGVLILAKSGEVQRNLQQQFAEHTIRKRYIAIVDGEISSPSGSISLPLILDPNDRPRQRVDYEQGKEAFTHYKLLSIEGGCSRLALYPQTGRTHQLRVHCAHYQGLNTPIVGDRLYGTASGRLMLHAEQITLIHPATGRKFTLSAEVEF